MNSENKKERAQFTGRLGFIVACIGSAVGMGNIWMFPYRAGTFGGAAFLIPYFIFVILLGFSGVIGEMAFGRGMGTGPMGAFAGAMELRFGQKVWEISGSDTGLGVFGHCHRLFRCGRMVLKISLERRDRKPDSSE